MLKTGRDKADSSLSNSANKDYFCTLSLIFYIYANKDRIRVSSIKDVVISYKICGYTKMKKNNIGNCTNDQILENMCHSN